MHAPAFEWKWNINTVAVMVGFASGFVAWGYTSAEMEAGRKMNATNIELISNRIATVESENRMLANHELRISALEKQGGDTSSALRAVEGSLNSLASDMRVTREILQRLEAASGRNR